MVLAISSAKTCSETFRNFAPSIFATWQDRTLARHDPERLVRGQQCLVEFVLRVKGGVIEHELHHFEQVVFKDVRVTLADCRELDIVDRFRPSPPRNSERVVIFTCSICSVMRWNRS